MEGEKLLNGGKESSAFEPAKDCGGIAQTTTSRSGGVEPIQFRDRIRELRRVKAKDLVRNPKNWRRHPKAQESALRGLLVELGYADVLLARELSDGRLMLIDGHLRAKITPDALVPVLVLDLTEQEADKLLATLDPLAGMAETDFERLRALLATIQTDSEAVKELLKRTAGDRLWEILHPGEVSEAEVSPDQADELRRKWATEPGQLWLIDRHRIICGDCRGPAVVARLWADGGPPFRTIWTDPPYGVDYASKNAYLNRTDRGNRIQKPIANDHAGDADALFGRALELAREWALEGAGCYATVPAGPRLPAFIDALNKSGFTFRQSLVWVKQQFVIGMSDYHHRHELVLYGWLGNGPHYFTEDRTQDSVFEVDRPRVSDLHPTTKPVELIARMIANSSRPGEVIYDPFSGSGSTLVAAHQLGRIGYGCEIDAGYLAVTLERLSLLGLKPQLVDE
jgi:DNA modification methylase